MSMVMRMIESEHVFCLEYSRRQLDNLICAPYRTRPFFPSGAIYLGTQSPFVHSHMYTIRMRPVVRYYDSTYVTQVAWRPLSLDSTSPVRALLAVKKKYTIFFTEYCPETKNICNVSWKSMRSPIKMLLDGFIFLLGQMI